MSDTTQSLRRKIKSAGDLQSVVRTMKALAASSIGQFEKSVRALGDYTRTVELGLGACFRENTPPAASAGRKTPTHAGAINAIVFGSDQGLVGKFNDVVADYTIKTLTALPGKLQIWAVGERVHARLADRPNLKFSGQSRESFDRIVGYYVVKLSYQSLIGPENDRVDRTGMGWRFPSRRGGRRSVLPKARAQSELDGPSIIT